MTDFYSDHVNPVKAISETNKVTERTVQLNYKKRLGFSAKELSRYQRFLKAIRLLQTMVADGTNVDWFTVIDECGFYDQSQLVHDFQHYLSLTPSQYLKLEQDICSPK
jgi:AraC-like DNA-binding protein